MHSGLQKTLQVFDSLSFAVYMTDRQAGRRTDGRTDGRAGGRTDGHGVIFDPAYNSKNSLLFFCLLQRGNLSQDNKFISVAVHSI
jgi:hypothetical protein